MQTKPCAQPNTTNNRGKTKKAKKTSTSNAVSQTQQIAPRPEYPRRITPSQTIASLTHSPKPICCEKSGVRNTTLTAPLLVNAGGRSCGSRFPIHNPGHGSASKPGFSACNRKANPAVVDRHVVRVHYITDAVGRGGRSRFRGAGICAPLTGRRRRGQRSWLNWRSDERGGGDRGKCSYNSGPVPYWSGHGTRARS